MTTDRFEVSTWDTDVDPVGRALVLPGGGYTVDHPLLFWSCQLAAGAGWQVNTMRWSPDERDNRDPHRFADEGAKVLAAAAPPAPVTVVIAKSYGTRAAAWVNARGYAGVWLTPVLTEEPVRAALTSPGPPALSIGGTSDRLWDAQVASQLRGTVLAIDGADHALHVGADWRASLAALSRAMEALESFLREQTD